jgi:hypothetical protein
LHSQPEFSAIPECLKLVDAMLDGLRKLTEE